jgi:protein-tyrosine phosphatase
MTNMERPVSHPIHILFLCHGNICRSPMAEFCMKDLARKAGRADQFDIASAALHADELGNPVYPPARRELAAHDIACAGKTARLAVPADYARFDYLVGMDAANRRDLLDLFRGDPDRKISLLLDWTGRPRPVADPWYTRDFAATWRDVLEGCTALLAALPPPRGAAP